MASEDPYLLPRSHPTESARLKAQHGAYTRALGYHLHPFIMENLLSDAPLIAEIATGTSIFLQELAVQHPSWQLHGFDISDAAYPSQDECASNIKLHVHNAKTPFPEEWHGKFDAVNIRLLILAMSSESDWELIASNARQLLKPGGVLQWLEGDYKPWHLRGSEALASDADRTSALHKVYALVFNAALGRIANHIDPATGDCVVLREAFARAGFEHVWEDIVSCDREVDERKNLTLITLQGALNVVEKAMGPNWVSEDEKMAMYTDVERGFYLRFDIHVCFGVKPRH